MRCNSSESRLNRTTPVGIYPGGATQQGVVDMAGNVWEWCLNVSEHPEKPKSVRLDDTDAWRVIRGGSWGDRQVNLRSSNRGWTNPDNRYTDFGFRLAQHIL